MKYLPRILGKMTGTQTMTIIIIIALLRFGSKIYQIDKKSEVQKYNMDLIYKASEKTK